MGCCGSKAPPASANVQKSPKKSKYKIAIVGLHTLGDHDKDAKGIRYDSIPMANGIVKHGMAAELIEYTPDDHDGFVTRCLDYDGVIIRFNPLQLEAESMPKGATRRFENAMDTLSMKGKGVWSTPLVQHRMGAKDALVQIKDLKCGLPDTFAYYDEKSFADGIKKSCAFSPRVIKQNRGTDGEGIWLVWLESKRYCETFGQKTLTDRDRLKLMEMNDNHVEYHTVKEFISFCINGPGGDAGDLWASSYPGKYLEGGRAQGGHIVDQRLLPRIVEGEVRFQMVGDTLYQIIHKKPRNEGDMSAVTGLAEYSYYGPSEPHFQELRAIFEEEVPRIFDALGISGEPLPLLWTADFIPVDSHASPYVVGEFNCSCVGIENFVKAIGASLKAVDRTNLREGYRLTDLIGFKVHEQLEEIKKSGGFTSVGKTIHINTRASKSFKEPPAMKGDIGREATPLPVRR